jgi:threonine dehydratase
MVGPHAFEVARHYVNECVLCTEKEVSLAILRLIENEKMVVEGGGAAGLAALLPGAQLDRPELKGKNIVVPLCGGNIDTTVLGRVLERGLAADDRLKALVATVSDRPGGIAKLTTLLGNHGASIKDMVRFFVLFCLFCFVSFIRIMLTLLFRVFPLSTCSIISVPFCIPISTMCM